MDVRIAKPAQVMPGPLLRPLAGEREIALPATLKSTANVPVPANPTKKEIIAKRKAREEGVPVVAKWVGQLGVVSPPVTTARVMLKMITITYNAIDV